MIFTIRWDKSMGCYRVSEPEFDVEGTGVEVVRVADLISDAAVERACEEIWPLANLSTEDARDELRQDMRRALAAAAMSREGSSTTTAETGTEPL